MILDTLSNADRYASLNPLFPAAIAFLRSDRAHSLPTGRYEIDRDRLYAMVIRDKGRGKAAAKLETHRRYIDIQFTVDGCDAIGWSHAGPKLKGGGYDAKGDAELYPGEPDVWTETPPGHFAIFFPEDAHAPMAGEGPLHKIVVKVAVG